MSQIPELPFEDACEKFARYGIGCEEDPKGRGYKLYRIGDGKAYRFAPTHDGWMRGTQLHAACQIFGIDAIELVFGPDGL